MTEDIEPGDLIRHPGNTMSGPEVEVAVCNAREPYQLIAKGPGWARHDGSSVNPVPGAECEIFGSAEAVVSPEQSEVWVWSKIKFYRVTREAAPSQPPAPQPGWVATAQIEWVGAGGNDASLCVFIKWPNGASESVYRENIASLPWSPPPPPPWEPVVGEQAMLSNEYGPLPVTVLCIDGPNAWVKLSNNHNRTAFVCDLSPPKGGA